MTDFRSSSPTLIRFLIVSLQFAGGLAFGVNPWEGDFISNVRQLTYEGRRGGECCFSPDGRQLVFMSEREQDNPFFQIGTGSIEYASTHLNPESEEKARAELDLRGIGEARRYTWDYDEHYDIFVAQPNGTIVARLRVTHRDGFDGLPVFSPDGQRLVWTSNRTDTGKSQIFLSQWNHEAARAAIESAPMRTGDGTSGSPASSRGDDARATLAPEIREEDLRSHVAFLASDELEGRLAGTTGAEDAAQYIEGLFRHVGLQPIMPDGSFFQPFEFASGVRIRPGGNHLRIGETSVSDCDLRQGYQPLAFSGSGAAEGEVVFAGYGLVEPRTNDDGYDSYAGIDVADKIVLALRDIPDDVSPKRRQELSRYAGDRYKAKLAADRGARAFLLVSGPTSALNGGLIPFREDDRTAPVAIPSITITPDLADRLLAGTGSGLRSLQSSLGSGDPSSSGVSNTGVHVTVVVSLERVRSQCRNVLAALPPRDESDGYVVIGGHYDHIGHGIGMGSLAPKEERGQIHNGADDNASGVSVVLELAARLAMEEGAGRPPTRRRGVIFACWSGEELGLIGSSHFAAHPPVPAEHIIAYLNFDMVGRVRDNRLIIQAVGSSPIWRSLIERHNIPAGFNLSLQDDPYLPTDSTAFYSTAVPCLSFFSDLHGDYNTPSDDANTLNYVGMERVARFAHRLVNDIRDPARDIPYLEVRQVAAPRSRMGRRAYTGIVPDFAGGQDVGGMLVSDVRPGGPAAAAGIQRGDVVVEFSGVSIASLRDYADALAGVRIGQPISIVVLRSGERVPLTITPAARRE
jgi:hypothetical protein